MITPSFPQPSRRSVVASAALTLLSSALPATSSRAFSGRVKRSPSDMSALAWMLADAVSGDVLAAWHPHHQLAPASTLKTLFALTVMPHLDADAIHTVSSSDLDSVPSGSSVVGLEVGAWYSIDELWSGVFLRSGNDAVRVLASLNGGWAETAAQMEDCATALGAESTSVISPDGFDAAGQVSTAHDLTVFGRAGLARADFLRNCGTKTAMFPSSEGRDGYITIVNTNRLLSGTYGVTPYPGIIGIKNGYTSRAGNTLIAAARLGGRTLIATVMNPQSGLPNAVYEEARSLLDWGFELPTDAEAISSLPSLPTDAALVRATP
ncbi:D-alanyl-D-alanine carboxypeptidase family protein [Streptomyces sp. NPDC005533]|uniref:D-alanyl-D-alanine carboxypeptidase family protein n=1 Tax=Streptomyces sp. NPDC005533 TaxID=3364723 RepID=UPI0036C98AF1